MELLSALGLALGLAMDALAVSISNGICIRNLRPRHAFKTGLFFGVFQGIMPVAGFLLGSTVARYISAYDHWVAFGLLALVGGNMIREALWGKEEKCADPTATGRLLLLSVATSIDALAVGVSLSLIGAPIWLYAGVIAVVTFGLSTLGVFMGKKLGDAFKKRASVAGGIVLVLMGIKILVEHLGG